MQMLQIAYCAQCVTMFLVAWHQNGPLIGPNCGQIILLHYILPENNYTLTPPTPHINIGFYLIKIHHWSQMAKFQEFPNQKRY